MVSTTEFARMKKERNELAEQVEKLKAQLAEYEKCDSEASEASEDAPRNYKDFNGSDDFVDQSE